jgi:signal transduction histidine kinase
MIESSTENGLGLSGETYLVGFDSLMRSQSRFSEHSVLLTKVKTFGVEQSLSGITGISIFEDYRGIKVLSSYGSLNIPNLNWVILAEIDISEAMAPVYNLRNNTLFIGIVIACLIFVFAYFFSERLTSPIRDLSKATLRIGNGEFRQSLPIQSNDEVGELTEGFNKMAGQLQQQQDELAQERQNTLRSMIDGQEQERQRLSRELHDGLGQSFIAIKLQLESFCDEIEGEKKEKLNKLKDYFEITIEDIRRMSNDLAPSVLKEFGLMTALRNLCRLFSEQSNIEIIYNSTGKIPKLTSKAQTYLYRIAQEALNNAVKHSEATEILVTLDGRADEVRLIIQDNGSGFDTNNVEASGGNGIQNMRERAYLLPGKIDINSVVNAGTTIEVKCSA